jgi:hypothetical protein
MAGTPLTSEEMQAAADVCSVYLRENPSAEALADKITRGTTHRTGFQGIVAEFAEGRARDMVLTQNPQSTAWDLTELRSCPRDAQVKMYADGAQGARSAIEDLRPVAAEMERGCATGILPREALEQAASSGVLVRRGGFYTPASGEKIVFLPAKSFASVTQSQAYA